MGFSWLCHSQRQSKGKVQQKSVEKFPQMAPVLMHFSGEGSQECGHAQHQPSQYSQTGSTSLAPLLQHLWLFIAMAALGFSCGRTCAFPQWRMLTIRILPDCEKNRSSPAHLVNHSSKETALVPDSCCSGSRDEFSLLHSNVGCFTWMMAKPPRGSKLRESPVLQMLTWITLASATCRSFARAIFAIPSASPDTFYYTWHFLAGAGRKSTPLQPVAASSVSPGCCFITYTAAAAGRKSTQKESPSLGLPTRRYEQTRRNFNLLREKKKSSVMGIYMSCTWVCPLFLSAPSQRATDPSFLLFAY